MLLRKVIFWLFFIISPLYINLTINNRRSFCKHFLSNISLNNSEKTSFVKWRNDFCLPSPQSLPNLYQYHLIRVEIDYAEEKLVYMEDDVLTIDQLMFADEQAIIRNNTRVPSGDKGSK